jgi:hypothetical protein
MIPDRASAIQREVHKLIDSQIATLRRSFLTDLDLIEYRDRAERIKTLYGELDQIKSARLATWRLEPRSRLIA